MKQAQFLIKSRVLHVPKKFGKTVDLTAMKAEDSRS